MSDYQPVPRRLLTPAIFSRIAANQRGSVLLFLLVAVTILGISAGIAGSTWSSIVQRAKEEDLLWKGNQIVKAIGSYYETKGTPGTPLLYPKSVDELLQDNRSINSRRHLRKPYVDPMTGEDWEWIKAPEGGFKGVRSTSKKKPFKMDGFREENKTFAGMWQYRDWEFIYTPKKKVVVKKKATPTSGTPTSGTPTSGTPTSGTPTAPGTPPATAE